MIFADDVSAELTRLDVSAPFVAHRVNTVFLDKTDVLKIAAMTPEQKESFFDRLSMRMHPVEGQAA